MLKKLPELIDPVVFADRESHVVGGLDVACLSRLSDVLFSTEGQLKVDLQFYRDAQVPKIEGSIKGDLKLICQSCLGAMDMAINKSVKIGMIKSMEQADRFEEGLEPLLVTGEKIALAAIVEDEILIDLPDYPRHGDSCKHYQKSEAFVESKRLTQEEPANPFAVLAQLKKSGDQ